MLEQRPRVLLADDHPLIREGLRRLLEPDFDVIGEVNDGDALLAAAARDRPDLVITNISMPGLDGIEATRRLRVTAPSVRVLILSHHAEPSWVRAAFAAGASGYLTKTSDPEEIEVAVREVLAGRFYVSPAVVRAAFLPAPAADVVTSFEPAGAASVETLTPREREILHLLARGMGNKDIARGLGVSVATVRTHLNSVYEKVGAESRVELALFAANASGAAV